MHGNGLMELFIMLLAGGAIWAIIWVLYVLLQTLIYGSLSCATGLGGLYIGSCVQSPDIFTFGDVTMTSSGIVAFLLMVATFKFLARFWMEASTAFPRIISPFSAPAK